MAIINYKNDAFSSLTYHDEIGDMGRVKLMWKKPDCKIKSEEVFNNWVMELLLNKNTEKHFKDIGKKGIYGFESIKQLEEEVLENAFSSGVDKVAVVLPQDVFPHRTTIGKKVNDNVEYFCNENNAKNWINKNMN